MAARHALRTFSCAPLALARPNQLQSSILPAVRSFKTGSSQRAGPVQKAAAATVPNLDDGTFIKGTVNDKVEFPPPSRMHGSLHWTFERVISAACIPVIASTFVTSPHPVLDGVLAATLVLHSHIGFDSAVTDYVHQRKFPRAGPIAMWTLRALTLGTLIGIYEFNTNDIGLTELVIRTWKA